MKPDPTQTHSRSPRLITAAEVAQRLGTSKSHVQYLRRADPSFPRCVKLGDAFNSAARFVESEIGEWIERRMEA